MIKFPLILLILICTYTSEGFANDSIKKTADLLVDAEALTINGNIHSCINGLAYQQNALMTFNGYQYVNWYDKNRHVCLARRKLPDGDWETLRLTDYVFGAGDRHYRAHDSHNNISMGICRLDGTIHLSFDHHMHPMNYRVSLKGLATDPDKFEWKPELFGPNHSILGKTALCKEINPHGLITYPRFIITPSNGLQLFYRAGNRNFPEVRVIHNYDSKTGDWSGPRPIIADNGYTNYMTRYSDSGNFHLLFHWRGSGKLCYLYTDNLGVSWKDNQGNTLLAPGDDQFIREEEADKACVIAPENATHIMLGGQYMDSKNRPHHIVWHIPNQTADVDLEDLVSAWGREIARYHHYWRDDEGVWQSSLLPMEVGSRAKLLLDEDDNAFVLFMVNRNNDWNRGISIRKGDLCIVKATASSNWSDWKLIHREPGPFNSQALFDHFRWRTDGIISVYAQESPDVEFVSAPPDQTLKDGRIRKNLTVERITQPTALRILEFVVN